MKKILLPISIAIGLTAGYFIWKSQMSEHCEGEQGCQHNHETAKMTNGTNQQLLDEVMAIHDEVMPKMSRMNELQQKMSNMASSTSDKALKDKYLDFATKLEKADNKMMDWMAEFPEDITKFSEEEANKILVSEKTKVLGMKEQVLVALKETEDFIMQDKK